MWVKHRFFLFVFYFLENRISSNAARQLEGKCCCLALNKIISVSFIIKLVWIYWCVKCHSEVMRFKKGVKFPLKTILHLFNCFIFCPFFEWIRDITMWYYLSNNLKAQPVQPFSRHLPRQAMDQTHLITAFLFSYKLTLPVTYWAGKLSMFSWRRSLGQAQSSLWNRAKIFTAVIQISIRRERLS